MEQPLTFEKELENLINRYNLESSSNTPDFILAEYLCACLRAWNETSTKRENWYGKSLYPGMETELTHEEWEPYLLLKKQA